MHNSILQKDMKNCAQLK